MLCQGHLHPWPLLSLVTSSTSIPGHLYPSLLPATVPKGTPSECSGAQRGTTQHPYHGHHPPNSHHTPHLTTAPSSWEKDT